jgi:hypothetical protein
MEPSKYNDNTWMNYDFEDLMGQKDRSKMFVTKLLDTNTGNCHSLPFIFKILSNEMKISSCIGAKSCLHKTQGRQKALDPILNSETNHCQETVG